MKELDQTGFSRVKGECNRPLKRSIGDGYHSVLRPIRISRKLGKCETRGSHFRLYCNRTGHEVRSRLTDIRPQFAVKYGGNLGVHDWECKD